MRTRTVFQRNKTSTAKSKAVSDFKRCSSLNASVPIERMFIARIATRCRINLDKIFVQGANAEEARQGMSYRGAKRPRADHDGFNQLTGSTGRVWSWVPKVYATRMYNLGADYQTSRIGAEEAQSVAHEIGKMLFADLNARGECNLLQFLSQKDAG